jgi:predicted helicase
METVKDFASLDIEAARDKYQLGEDVRDWRVEWAQNDLKKIGIDRKHSIQIHYRPFDFRWTYFTRRSRGFLCYPRAEVTESFIPDGLGLVSARSNKSPEMDHFLVTQFTTEAKTGESTTQSQLFTVFAKADTSILENTSEVFRTFLDTRYSHHYEPEEILGYIYAILHAPSYRRRYAEFLRIDFPRIPFCETKAQFDALARLGSELVQVHLLKKLPRKGLGDFHGKGDNTVEAIRYSPQEQSIHINAAQHFAPLPEEVWNFHIGGYQVLDKWLKSRKTRKLELDDLLHVGKVADALAFTIEQMSKIDVAYLTTFPGRG